MRPSIDLHSRFEQKKDQPSKDLEEKRAAYPEAVGTYLQSPLDWLQGLIKTRGNLITH
jgi:hypothetical protein